MSTSLRVTEIFYSIQGESTHAGLPCVFIRLTGCPLRCTWCDTAYAFTGGKTLTLESILNRISTYHCSLVEVTGGEPLAQPNCRLLLRSLCEASYTVLLETSGAYDLANIDPRVIKIMDLKCPSSGESARNRFDNIPLLTARDEVKFVIANRLDYDWATEQLTTHRLASRCVVLFSPVWDKLPLHDLATWVLTDRLPVRIQIQLHKHIWGPDRRGT